MKKFVQITLNQMLLMLDTEEVVHVVDDEKTLFFGTARTAGMELDENTLDSYSVSRLHTGFSGLCVEVKKEEN